MAQAKPAGTAADGFAGLGLGPRLLKVLGELGYEEPTPIQRAAIPPLLAGRDLLGQAATGTGKTAAFALPLLQRLPAGGRDRPTAALVLVPTRELAMQVAEAIHRYGGQLAVSVAPIYGGQPIGQQFRLLRRGVDVVVATPGRALDHIRRGTLALGAVQTLVLDEADEMLDMGFAEDLEAILEAVPRERQTALFSATIPRRIATLADKHLRDPERVTIAEEKTPRGELPRIRQVAYVVPRAQKLASLGRILDLEEPAKALVFCRTRNEVDALVQTLGGRGYRAEALHGGMAQKQRDRVMKGFREGAVDLVLATDVAARGLDIGQLSHVVNYDVPCSPDAYVHRIGRTGRAGREGVAITLAEPREERLLRAIERTTGRRLEIATVPTVADLRARRLELTRASLREALVEGGLETYRAVVEALGDEFDVLDIAAAGVKLAHRAGEAAEAPRRTAAEAGRPRPEGAPRAVAAPAPTRKPAPAGAPASPRAPLPRDGNVVRVYVSAGRLTGIRPNDLVGAITGEAGLDGRAIGAIEIADRYSLVEVPEAVAARVVKALGAATLRGRPITASVYREPAARAARAKATRAR
jgi:ATP-dependent RNA helicase DeaD